MCGRQELRGVLFLSAIVVAAIAAPVNELKQDVKRSVETVSSQSDHQDKDLEDLMNLVQQQAKQDGTMVHKHEMTHIETSNGETHKVKETEEQVIDSNTGDVIAAVKQEVNQDASGGEDGHPRETVVETKVDIPSEGVHETIVQDDGQSEEQQEDGKSEAVEEETHGEGEGEQEQYEEGGVVGDLTPADMAEFLMATQQFELFYTALEKLVNQSKMTEEDAEEYARVVALEYQRLALISEGMNMERRSQLPSYIAGYPSLVDEEYQPYQAAQPEAFMTPEEKYLAYLQQQQQQRQEEQLLLQQQEQGELNPYDFLTALWEEAFDRGNEEAQAIVQMLYDRVNSDDNMDDMGQISHILVDTVASSFPYGQSALAGDEEAQPVQQSNDLTDNQAVEQTPVLDSNPSPSSEEPNEPADDDDNKSDDSVVTTNDGNTEEGSEENDAQNSEAPQASN